MVELSYKKNTVKLSTSTQATSVYAPKCTRFVAFGRLCSFNTPVFMFCFVRLSRNYRPTCSLFFQLWCLLWYTQRFEGVVSKATQNCTKLLLRRSKTVPQNAFETAKQTNVCYQAPIRCVCMCVWN